MIVTIGASKHRMSMCGPFAGMCASFVDRVLGNDEELKVGEVSSWDNEHGPARTQRLTLKGCATVRLTDVQVAFLLNSKKPTLAARSGSMGHDYDHSMIKMSDRIFRGETGEIFEEKPAFSRSCCVSSLLFSLHTSCFVPFRCVCSLPA